MDGSAVVAMLVDVGPAGEWSTAQATDAYLAAPDIMPYEAANILRRHALAGILDATAATLAHADLTALPLHVWPYTALAERAWALRDNLTIYGAAYVALAELLKVPLVTLDAGLARAPGLPCPVVAYGPA